MKVLNSTNPFVSTRHEFGHILQAYKWGIEYFYNTFALASVLSADRSSSSQQYQVFWTVWSANYLPWKYFQFDKNWQKDRLPIGPNPLWGAYSSYFPLPFYM